MSSKNRRSSTKTVISAAELSPAVKESLEQYGALTGEQMKRAIDKTAKEALSIIRENAPVRTGKYRKSIGMKTVQEGEHTKVVVIRAGGHEYRLSHLLEKGHNEVIPRGKQKGKVVGHTRAFPHFSKGDAYVDENLASNIKKEMEEN